MSDKLVTNNKKILDKITPFLVDNEEILICTEVVKHHAHGGKDSRIMLLTNFTFSLIRMKAFGNPIRSHEFSVLSLKKVVLEDKLFTLTFDESITFDSDQAVTICQILLNYYGTIFYQNTINVEIQSTPPGAIEMPKFATRPANLSYMRLKLLAFSKKVKLNLTVERLMKEYDARQLPQVKISSQHVLEDPLVIADVFIMEPGLTNLYLDNFAPKQIDKFVLYIVERSKSLMSLTFANYQEDFSPTQIKIICDEECKIGELTIVGTKYEFASSVFTAFSKYAGRIQSIKFERAKFEKDQMQKIFSSLHKHPAFMKVKYISLNDGTIDNIDLNDLHYLFARLRNLKYLIINKSNIDMSAILTHVFKHASILENLSIQNCRFLEVLDESVIIPPCIQMLDLSENQVAPAAIGSLFKTLLTNPRRNVMTVYLSKIACTGTMSDLVDAICIKDALPIIAEFRFTKNELLPPQAKKLFEFLETQSCLKYLTLSNCFIENIEENFNLLAKFIQESKLAGLEMIGTPISQNYCQELVKMLYKLVGCKNLHVLQLDKSEIGSEGLKAIRAIIESSPSFYSLSVDGAKPSSLEDLIEFYKFICEQKQITGVGLPRSDFELFKASILKCVPEFKGKQPPMNAQARLKIYSKISTRNINTDGPRPIVEVLQDDGICTHTLTNPIEELMMHVKRIMNGAGYKMLPFGDRRLSAAETEDSKQEILRSYTQFELQEDDEEGEDDQANLEELPPIDELAEMFIDNLQTSLIPCMSNRFRITEMSNKDDVYAGVDPMKSIVAGKLDTQVSNYNTNNLAHSSLIYASSLNTKKLSMIAPPSYN